MQANPALPWTTADGGRIILTEPITNEEIIAGALDFIVRGGTPVTDKHLHIAERSTVYETLLDGDLLWTIDKITSPSTELIINRPLTAREGYNLISIERLGYIDGKILDGVEIKDDGGNAYATGLLRNEQGSITINSLLTFDGIHAIGGQNDGSLVITNSDEINEGSVFGLASIPQALQTLDLIKVKTIVHQGYLALKPIFVPNDLGLINITDTQGDEIMPGYSGNIIISEQ